MGTFYTGASGVGTGPHLDFRIWDVDKGSYINPSGFTDVLSVNDKPLTEQFAMTSGFGPRPVPTPGASSNHLGIDYATPAGTPVQIKGGKFITTFNDARGGRMSQYGIQRDGKNYDVLLLHGSDQNQLLSDGARTDFDYSSLGTPNLRPQAKERATAFKQTTPAYDMQPQTAAEIQPQTAADVVQGFGNDFSAMKSARLGDALRGAQENIIQKRMN